MSGRAGARFRLLGVLPLLASPAFSSDTLYVNGVPDGINAYANGTEDVYNGHRSLLDDFVVPAGESWTVSTLHWHSEWTDFPPLGTGAQVAMWTDVGGVPGVPFIALTVTNYDEIPTGRVFFTIEETESWADFEPVRLPEGRYWFEANVIAPEPNFWLTAPQQNEECWVNYEDLGGLQPGSEVFGSPADLAWSLLGVREVVGSGACCFPDGACLETSYVDCATQGGLHQGDGSRCDIGVCGASGACCLPDATCVEQSLLFCAIAGGGYVSVGSSCADVECVAPCGSFATAMSSVAGDSPNAVGTGDLDRDADVDVVVALRSNRAAVLMNNGDGTFAAPVVYTAGGRSVAIGDLDGDLHLDLAMPGYDVVVVLLNDGNGRFAPRVGWPTGSLAAQAVTMSDLDGDHDLDLAVASHRDELSVLLNHGDATFGPPAVYAAGDDPLSVVAADLDGDGDPDLAVANDGSHDVSVFLNDGDGTFGPSTNYDTSRFPRSLVAGDLDGDLDTDLAVAGPADEAEAVSVLLNNGDGTFAPPAFHRAGRFSVAIAISDVDADGDQDLAVADAAGEQVSVLLNDGSAGFELEVRYATGDQPDAVTLADLNGDLHDDLVVANHIGGDVSVLLNNCRPCAEDLDDSGAVDFGDILAVLAAWGDVGGPADLDHSGAVDFGDILAVLAAWGPCPGVFGACCFDGGDCVEGVLQGTCVEQGGTFLGGGTACVNCGFGACCFVQGSCVDTVTIVSCSAMGGHYLGDGSTCVDDCFGACCLEDGTCFENTTEGACESIGGLHQGGGSDCGETTCRGACCLGVELCVDGLTRAACGLLDGTYQGDDTLCGELCEGPCGWLVEAPFSWAGSLCDEDDTCTLGTGPDIQWAVTIPADGDWTFTTCGQVETVLYVDTVDCCGDDQSVRGLCESVTRSNLTAGQTVFVTLEATEACGAFSVLVSGP